MKRIIGLIGFVAFAAVSATNSFVTIQPTTVKLSFTYPSGEIGTNLEFRVYTSTNLSLPHENWDFVTNFSSVDTNFYTAATNDGVYVVRVPLHHGAQFWAATAKDTFYGESFFSNDAWTNPLPRLDRKIIILPP